MAAYRKAFAKYFPDEQPGFISLEGFVDALALVEGLKRAGKELTSGDSRLVTREWCW